MADISVECIAGDEDFNFTLHRDQFEGMISPILEKLGEILFSFLSQISN